MQKLDALEAMAEACQSVRVADLSLYGPWAVVAGGSEGVGRSFATQLADAGIHLLLVARRPGPLEEAAAECRERGVEVRTLAVDLTAPDAVARVAEAVADVEVGLLAYNAGANTHSEPFLDGDLAEFQRVVDLNVTTPLALVHHFGRPMRDRRRGGILLVGSLAGYLGSVRHTTYGGVKAFGRIFAEGLWLELLEHDVHVLELVLGVTRTPAMERVGLNFDVPGLRVAEPDDVAREGLERLPHGPVHVAGGNAETVERRSHPDRARAVLGAHRMMQQLMEGSR
jgi:short-subunit dehydrogenase